MLQWLPFLAFPAIAGFWLWSKYRTRQRGPAVARFASQHGMSYSTDGYVSSPGYDFPLLRQGDDSGYKNVLAGRWQDLPVKEAGYWYSTTVTTTGPQDMGRERGYAYFPIVVADLAANVPYVSVQAKNMFTKAAEHLGCTTSTSNPRTSTGSSG
jgi:hypothetical protein